MRNSRERWFVENHHCVLSHIFEVSWKKAKIVKIWKTCEIEEKNTKKEKILKRSKEVDKGKRYHDAIAKAIMATKIDY